jgi:hypothetical protein
MYWPQSIFGRCAQQVRCVFVLGCDPVSQDACVQLNVIWMQELKYDYENEYNDNLK